MAGKNRTEEGNHGIRLPGSLLDELKTREDTEDDTSRYKLAANFDNKKRKLQVSRKEKRKQERSNKKKRKSTPTTRKSQPKNGSKNQMKNSQKKIESSDQSSDEENEEFEGFSDSEKEQEDGQVDTLEDDNMSFGDSDDYEDFEQDLSEGDFDDLDEDDDGPDGDQPATAEDTMKALMALKLKKKEQQESQPSAAEETMALLKAKKEAKQSKEKKEPTADETMELLKKKQEEKKKTQETKKDVKVEKSKTKNKSKNERYLTPEDASLLKRDEDDIKYYAKKLGLKSTKLSELKDDEDGLGGLFDDLDFLDNNGDDDNNDNYNDYSNLEESETASFSESEEEIISEDDNQEDNNDDGEDIVENPFSSDDEINSSDFDSDLDEELNEEDEEAGDVLRPAPKENPYVAPVSASSTTKYIPPALRQKLQNSDDSEQSLRIKRSIKGPLNKLSEANIMTIVNEINTVFLDNPRQVVIECLTDILLQSIIQQGVLLDTFVILHAALIAAIYRLQGVEIGAFFVQTLVEKYEQYYKEKNSKASGNLISLLTSCYSFQIVSCKLLYDLISNLIQNISELNSELLLRIVKNAGQQMRVDDPSSLKEIILTLQKNVNIQEANSRTKFLIETITNLKNNKSKLSNEITHNLIIRMKKVLASINNNKFHESLKVSLDDIHNVETKGKWWLVGAAWKGNDSSTTKPELEVDRETLDDILDSSEPNWLELARAQRMNTDIRRAIFISIMSSNDYIEAFTKLDKLRLKKAQEREIPRILLHCVSIEKAYNPYYGLLANKLCSSHTLRKTIQFNFWDILKELEGDDEEGSDDEGGANNFLKSLSRNMSEQNDDFQLQRTVNLGKFFGVLIAEGSLPLHSLKNVNFVSLNSDSSQFLEVLLISFFDSLGKKSEIAAFGAGSKKSKASELKFQDNLLIERVAKCREQRSLLRGLQYFLQKKTRDSDLISGRKQRRRVEWGVDSTCDIVDEFLKRDE